MKNLAVSSEACPISCEACNALLSRDLVKSLGCPCLEFHQADSMQTIIKTYWAYQEFGKHDGFLPLLVRANMFFHGSAKQDGVPDGEKKTVAEAAEEASNLDIPVWTRSELAKRFDGYDEILADLKRDEGLSSPMPGKYDFTKFLAGFCAPESEKRCDSGNILLACVPGTNPWTLPFWITPSGAPSMVEQMAFFRHWHTLYGATPATVSSDSWSLIVARPPETFAAAEALAWEHFAFCQDCVYEMGLEPETIRALAEHLIGASVWHFWWD